MALITPKTEEQIRRDAERMEKNIALVKKTFELKGKILVSNGNFRGYTTFAEFEAFARAGIRSRRKLATDLLRKAVAEYPGECDTDEYRKPKDSYLAFNDETNRVWVEYNLPARLRHDPQNPTTIDERLRAHWLRADKHPPGLFGIEIEFATEQKFETKTIQYGRGVCDNGPECCPPVGPTIEKIIKRLLPSAIYRDIEKLIPGVKIKTDGSVNPAHSDAQEANLLAGPNGFGRLKKLCEMIKERGGIVNKTCGLHVHLDARKEERRVVGIRADKLFDFMPVLLDLVPPERATSEYCLIEKPAFNTNRRRAINLAAYDEHSTIEVRLGAGSLNPSKIWHWAHLLLYVSRAKTRYPSWDEFLTSNFPLPLRIWSIRRANELRPNAKLMKSRINTIAPGLDDMLNQEYNSESVDVSESLKGTNV